MSSSKLLLCLFFAFVFFNPINAQLKVGFYKDTCPKAESIVKDVMHQVLSVAPTLGAPMMRMHFHDCFVRGCDGSLLLNSPRNDTEKFGPPNLSLRGFQSIDRVKRAVEAACPGVVSCADILAIVARDVTNAFGGPWYEVETGRRDGRVSILNETLTNLIPPTANITTLINGWARKGLTPKDLVVLSGAHTIGNSHCTSFTERLYNFTGNGTFDPRLDSEYRVKLMQKCRPGDNTTLVEMDPGSFKTFDESYYNLVSKRRGLFQSDHALLENQETRDYVIAQAAAGPGSFFNDFGPSMRNMGRIEVMTGSAGEIRRICTAVN